MIFPASSDKELQLSEFQSTGFSFCPNDQIQYTLHIESPTSEDVGNSGQGTAPFTFDPDTLKITVSGSIEYEDNNGDGYDGTIQFKLCVNNESLCDSFTLAYHNCDAGL